MVRQILSVLFVTGAMQIRGASAADLPVCAVAGFVNELGNEQWNDARVGMGVRALLAQAVHETGLFAMLDEKKEVTETIRELSAGAWTDKKGTKRIEEAVEIAGANGARFVASGRVFYFGKPRTKASVGPMHFSSDEVLIKVEVQLSDVKKRKTIKAVGVGKAKTTSTSALFTFHNDRLDADKTMVATATRKAITDAVDEIAKKYRKKYKIK